VIGVNAIGAVTVLVLALYVVPLPPIADAGSIRELNGMLALAYLLVAVVAGVGAGTRGLRGVRDWLREERPATLREAERVLRAPVRLFALQVALWLIAAALFGGLDASYSGSLGWRVAVLVATTGLVTAATGYLFTELLLRPAAARALAPGLPGRPVVPGVATRLLLAWLLGTGLELAGLVAVGVLALEHDASLRGPHLAGITRLGVSMVALAGAGLIVGFVVVLLVARTTADPIDSVRHALARVQRGEHGVRVPVYDGTQIGQLQLGFNEMAAGLEERERIRRALGTYVDPDVAERIIDEGAELHGEQVEVTVMFIDIRDFTGFAARRSAERVLVALNDLFAQFVATIHRHDGWVDKFVGDGLLAVFGAPRHAEDHADRALRAALQIVTGSRSRAGLSFGVGLNSGTVVAGNVGGSGRLEFTVIGDPVNVASRVEAATRETGDRILLSERTVSLLRDPHPPLVERDVKLRGVSAPLCVFALATEEPCVQPEG
jgi:adenylate cyclase